MNPTLRCQESELPSFAERYQYPLQEKTVLGLRSGIVKRGFMTKDELRIIAQWKAPRSSRRMEKNPEEYVKEITGFALNAATERARVEVLTTLDGVRWPSASVILHFFHKEPYPIMDFRALRSVSLPVPAQCSFGFWWPYVQFCRDLSKNIGLDMRTLDRALWQYSKEHQGSA
jgi:hypothetical protein